MQNCLENSTSARSDLVGWMASLAAGFSKEMQLEFPVVTFSSWQCKLPSLTVPFQRLVSTVLTADEDQRNLKDVGGLMTIISLLTTHLTPAGPEYEQVFTWVRKLCEEGNVGK